MTNVSISRRLGAVGLALLAGGCRTSASDAEGSGRRFPAAEWLAYESPEEAGFSTDELDAARRYFATKDWAAILVVHDGVILAQWGDVDRRFMCHSVRKSLLSALIGIEVDAGRIDLGRSLAQLGIDDEPPLTDAEKRATIADLIRARSGVYHTAAYKSPSAAARRPQRGSHAPDTFYYYNNWDFNALGTIFERTTASTVFEEFERDLAEPLQMQDFRLGDCYHHLEAHHSRHPAYPFRLSARDLGRFGLLFLRRGEWRGRRIVSESWVDESTAAHSRVGEKLGYGYMWWRILEEPFESLGAFAARGYGGHSVTVIPGADLVIVHRVPTSWDLEPEGPKKALGARVSNADQLAGFRMILDARIGAPVAEPRLVASAVDAPRIEPVPLGDQVLDALVGKYEFRGESHEDFTLDIVRDGSGLALHSPWMGRFALFARSSTEFLVEDIEVVARFDADSGGSAAGLTVELFRPGQPCRGERVAGGEPAIVR